MVASLCLDKYFFLLNKQQVFSKRRKAFKPQTNIRFQPDIDLYTVHTIEPGCKSLEICRPQIAREDVHFTVLFTNDKFSKSTNYLRFGEVIVSLVSIGQCVAINVVVI